MSGIGGFLLAIGLADLVAGGLAGSAGNRLRAGAGVIAAIWSATVVGWWLRLSNGDLLLFVGIVGATATAWIGLRIFTQKRPRVGILALAAWAAGALLVVAWGNRWAGEIALVERWLADAPLPLFATWSSSRWLLLLGAFAFLSATSNAIVRSILRATGTEFERSRRHLRGGRVIGTLERWLIFGLAIAGEPTAAALIVSAKSLLRFPELSRLAREETPILVDPDSNPLRKPRAPIPAVDYITEYFLMGSLVSWTLALGSSLLLR